jgi:hypothetical protein
MPSSGSIQPEDLNAYLDGELTAGEAASIEAHLVEHPDQQQELSELRGLVSLLAHLPQYEPPRSFSLSPEHLRDAETPNNVVRFLPVVRMLSVAAVLAFLVVGALAVFEYTNDDTDSTGDLANQQNPAETGTGDPTQASKEATGDSTSGDGGLVDRGDSAANNAVAPEAPGSGDSPAAAGDTNDVAQADATPTVSDAVPEETPVTVATTDDSDDDDNTWLITGAGLGVLALVLIGLWVALVRTGRSPRRTT